MLAIIPARGGSKGLPGKNIKNLKGKPLIEWTIEAALKSKCIDEVVVSTEDKKIASIAENAGASVPFLRPQELATDHSLAIDVYLYTIDKLIENTKNKISSFVVLQPTSPLRNSDDIDNAIELFNIKKADSVISVVESPHPPEWIKTIDQDGILKNLIKNESLNKNRHDFSKTYIPNGAIFVFNIKLLKDKYKYYSDKTYPYIMPRERSIDIDDIFDFKFAEHLLRYEHDSIR